MQEQLTGMHAFLQGQSMMLCKDWACDKGLHVGRKQWLAELQVCLMLGRGHETTLLNGILYEVCPSGGKNSCQECRIASRSTTATRPNDVMACHREEGWVCHRGRI